MSFTSLYNLYSKSDQTPPLNRLEFKRSIFLFSLDLTESSRRSARRREVKFLRRKCYFCRKNIVGQTSTDPFQGTRFVFTLANSILKLYKGFFLLWTQPTAITVYVAAVIVPIHGQIAAMSPRLLWLLSSYSLFILMFFFCLCPYWFVHNYRSFFFS